MNRTKKRINSARYVRSLRQRTGRGVRQFDGDCVCGGPQNVQVPPLVEMLVCVWSMQAGVVIGHEEGDTNPVCVLPGGIVGVVAQELE